MTQSDQNPPVEQIINGVAYFGNPATGLSFNRWSPAFGAINALQSNGKSSYNFSLQANAVHRFSHNFRCAGGVYVGALDRRWLGLERP